MHGGGFYHPVKFNVSPPQLPQSTCMVFGNYSTWLSGFALFTVIVPLQRQPTSLIK